MLGLTGATPIAAAVTVVVAFVGPTPEFVVNLKRIVIRYLFSKLQPHYGTYVTFPHRTKLDDLAWYSTPIYFCVRHDVWDFARSHCPHWPQPQCQRCCAARAMIPIVTRHFQAKRRTAGRQADIKQTKYISFQGISQIKKARRLTLTSVLLRPSSKYVANTSS